MKLANPNMCAILLFLLVSHVSPFAAPTTTVRVCTDKDCLIDGANDTLQLARTLSPSSVKVETCGCLGPCGGGPNIDVRVDGVRMKDKRPGRSSFYCFKEVRTDDDFKDVLRVGAGVEVKKTSDIVATSTRGPLDFDRTTKIALQRLLYIATFLPMQNAAQTGQWDSIKGIGVVDNSYYVIGAGVLIGSQFMGTGAKANSGGGNKEDD
jgi:hypothetical protein